MITEHSTDWRGNVIRVGDTVLYPAQQGSSSAHLVEGVVTSFDEGPERYNWEHGMYRPDRIRVRPTRRSGYGQERAAWDGKPEVIPSSLDHVVWIGSPKDDDPSGAWATVRSAQTKCARCGHTAICHPTQRHREAQGLAACLPPPPLTCDCPGMVLPDE